MKQNKFQSLSSEVLSKLKSQNEIIERRKDIVKRINRTVQMFGFKSQTFYLAVSFFDEALKNEEIRALLRTVEIATGCFILAVKFDEMDSIIPYMNHFQSIFGEFFSLEELRKFEFLCLKALRYDLNHFTAYHYLNYFCTYGIVFTDDLIQSSNYNSKSINSQDVMIVFKKNHVNGNYEQVPNQIALKLYDKVKEILLLFTEGEIK